MGKLRQRAEVTCPRLLRRSVAELATELKTPEPHCSVDWPTLLPQCYYNDLGYCCVFKSCVLVTLLWERKLEMEQSTKEVQSN